MEFKARAVAVCRRPEVALAAIGLHHRSNAICNRQRAQLHLDYLSPVALTQRYYLNRVAA